MMSMTQVYAQHLQHVRNCTIDLSPEKQPRGLKFRTYSINGMGNPNFSQGQI